MTKSKTLFFIFLTLALGFFVYALSQHSSIINKSSTQDELPATKYGAFLAAQHAIYANDFDRAADFYASLKDVSYEVVQDTYSMIEFLGGKVPNNVESFADEQNIAARLIYDASLAKNNQWKDMYKRFHTNESAVYAPFRIWSGIGAGHKDDVLKYIESVESNPSWKAFVCGQIYAESGDIKKAAEEFARVRTDFMNINDYFYIMSFYRAHGLHENEEILRKSFSETPGGMFLVYHDDIPDWETNFSGIKNVLAFSLAQHVSHTQMMLFSDLSVLMLRFAQIIGPETQFFRDTINYYTGLFFINTRGNYGRFFDSIPKDSPFFLFAKMQTSNSVTDMKKILNTRPLFIPALNKLVAEYIRAGDKNNALLVINRMLTNEKLSDSGRSYLMKRRAFVHMLFRNYEQAQEDIHEVSKLQIIDSEILMIQARIWVAQNREIENAYNYAMALVRRDPTDISAWDTVATVVLVREGNDAALDILERISATANTCSALFEHLGDAYVVAGKYELALESYNRAIELSEDGLVIVPNIKKKIRKIK